MNAVETSALVAMFPRHPGHGSIADPIAGADAVSISVVSRVESVSVLCGKRIGAEPVRVEGFIDALRLDHVPVSQDQMRGALGALLRFGKGCHPAALNLGNCSSHALARALGAPLLFKGDDFSRTDVVAAWRP